MFAERGWWQGDRQFGRSLCSARISRKRVARDLFDEAVKFVKKKGAVDVESGCPYCKKQLLLLNEKGKVSRIKENRHFLLQNIGFWYII